VNVHAHLELPPLARHVKAKDYARWVLRLLQAKKELSQRDYVAAALSNCKTLLMTGTTTVGEISTHEASPGVIRQNGLRSVVYHEIITMRPDDPPKIPTGLVSTALIAHGLSPHSPHTISPDALKHVRSFARRRSLRLSMHVAETIDEELLLQRRPSGLDRLYAAADWSRSWAPSGRSSFDYLERSGMLSARFLAVHAVHADARDRVIIRRTHTAIAHCPRSNRAMRIGTLPLRTYLDQGIIVGLGTDSLASVPTLSLWDEMRAALEVHVASGVTARDLLAIATKGGACALGLGREIGTLAPGKRADLIAVPAPRRDSGDLCSDLLRETKSCTMTMVNGKVLYRSRPVRT
jgi:cytosine/adenosine deaminase-related metal-dependent hydrolase